MLQKKSGYLRQYIIKFETLLMFTCIGQELLMTQRPESYNMEQPGGEHGMKLYFLAY